jgi:hypothetical protein
VRLGDCLANAGEYNKRHNGVMYKAQRMVSAVAVGAVIQGDKTKPELTQELNATHTIDLAELGGDEATGADVLYEIKVPSPLVKSKRVGRGTQAHGGVPAAVGHLYDFGNTLEEYEVTVFGSPERGRPRDGAFDHSTGRGWVAKADGQYKDALAKKLKIVLFLVEAFGGISPAARKQMHVLAGRAKGRGSVDRTRYGRNRFCTRSFYKHHEQQISKAAVLYDAQAIKKAITSHKVRHFSAANAVHAGGAMA